jgi:hypothetical protein
MAALGAVLLVAFVLISSMADKSAQGARHGAWKVQDLATRSQNIPCGQDIDQKVNADPLS